MTKPYRFKEWLAFFISVDLPIGDLAKDVAKDKNFPDVQDRQKIYDYMKNTNASRAALDTFEDVWKFYIKTR